VTEKQPGAARPVPSPGNDDAVRLAGVGEAVELATCTTLRVGGPAARFVSASSTDRVIDAVSECDARGEPVLVLGGGSNLLVSDEGFDGTVVRIDTVGFTVESADRCGGASVRVAAGEPWDALVAAAVDRRWSGVEALSGIPGSTGATPVQNVGAYGQEVADTVASVRTWDRQEGRVRTLASADCEFSYRHSRFKEERFRGGPRFVILEVTFQLVLADLSGPVRYPELARALGVEVGARAPLEDVRRAVLALRRSKGMVLDPADHDTWSAGSFFTNPLLDPAAADRLPSDAPRWPAAGGRVKTSAAWLIEHAGFTRGYGLPGPAALSTRHTLALTNRGGARAKDVVELARTIQDGVRVAFGVELAPEPVLVGVEL
jgi:UDP-N-acetylmuramate dehydrogenase